MVQSGTIEQMTKLSREDILNLAKLAKLSLTDQEIAQYQTELSEILGLVETLENADTDGLEPTTQVTGLTNVTRADVVRQYGMDQAALLRNVPSRKDNEIKVRRVL